MADTAAPASGSAPSQGTQQSNSFIREAFRGQNRFLLRIAIIAAIGGFLFGYDTGIISGAQIYITKDLHASQLAQQWIVGALLIGAMCGAAIAIFTSDKVGRKWTKVGAGTIYVAGGLLSAFAPNIPILLIARFILGLAVGTASFVSVEYISEQAPPRLRGGVTTFNQMMVTTGILVAYLVAAGFQNVGGTWRWMLGLSAVPGAVLAIGMVTVPRSPRWLVEHDHDDEARDVLGRTRDDQQADDEVADIRDTVDESQGVGFGDLFRRPLRPVMMTGLALAIFQQLIGVNTVIYYSATILKATGLSANASVMQAVSVGITNVIFTIVAVLLLDRVGRRPLLLTGTVGATASLVCLGLWFQISAWQSYGWLALVFLLVFMASFAVGLGPVFWLMISEIYPQSVRSKAMGIATIANWGANFIVSYFFLQLVSGIGRPATFWIYAGFGVVAFAYFASKLPETKDKSLEEIQSELGASDGTSAEQGDHRAAWARRPERSRPERVDRRR